jgi:hypothetical protein
LYFLRTASSWVEFTCACNLDQNRTSVKAVRLHRALSRPATMSSAAVSSIFLRFPVATVLCHHLASLVWWFGAAARRLPLVLFFPNFSPLPCTVALHPLSPNLLDGRLPHQILAPTPAEAAPSSPSFDRRGTYRCSRAADPPFPPDAVGGAEEDLGGLFSLPRRHGFGTSQRGR